MVWVIVEEKYDIQGGYDSDPLGIIYGPYKKKEIAEVMLDQIKESDYDTDYRVVEVQYVPLPSNIDKLLKKKKEKDDLVKQQPLPEKITTQCNVPKSRFTHYQHTNRRFDPYDSDY